MLYPGFILSVKIFNPSHCLHITAFPRYRCVVQRYVYLKSFYLRFQLVFLIVKGQEGNIGYDQVGFIILNKVIVKCLLPGALIGFQLNSLMIDFSLTSSIQIIKTKVKIPCLM